MGDQAAVVLQTAIQCMPSTFTVQVWLAVCTQRLTKVGDCEGGLSCMTAAGKVQFIYKFMVG